MSKNLDEYNKVVDERISVVEEIQKLRENKHVKKYLELEQANKDLYARELECYCKLKREEYENCDHIIVCTNADYDTSSCEQRVHKNYGCIKCGADTYILDCERSWLDYKERVMYDYLRDEYKKHLCMRGMDTGILCDLELGVNIYSRIKEANPDIDDLTAINYFTRALDNIRNQDVSEERKVSRARRLSLSPSFERWNGRDVFNY